MKFNFTRVLLTFLLFSVVAGCSKKKDVGPSGPIVGQWMIIRSIVAGLPASLSSLNGTTTTNLLPENYVFRNDGSYTYTLVLPAASGGTTTETGTWLLNATTVTLTPKDQATSYTLLYSATANELTTGPISTSQTLDNPANGATETVTYTLEYVYKKKS